MLNYEEALALVVDLAKPLGAEDVSLSSANRRVLAAPLISRVSSPPADVSAMDGYAVRDADLAETRSFRLIGVSYPGTGFAGSVGQGEAVRIFTGAPIPDGADRVLVQEIITRDGDDVQVTGEWGKARHIRLMGNDFKAGDEILPAGCPLNARSIVAAAGADRAVLSVWRQPRVAIIGTGDELVEPGSAAETAGHIPDSLSYAIAAFAEEQGAVPVSRQRCGDNPEMMKAMAAQALAQADVVVITGGASVGEKDFSKGAFAALGAEMIFSKVAIKPGKPVWLARVGDRLVLGLPGNPTSALVTARLFLAPLLAGLGGRDPNGVTLWRSVPAAQSLPAGGDRETFVRAILADGKVSALRNQDSGAQQALAQAGVLIRMAVDAPPVAAGETVQILDL
ncbi:MAG: molybdopterin molybdotransferase MoeA [Sphingobium sp.]|nr:molybdopterin molybdotransferase MoeA [Sphingobium sp.]